MKTPPPTSKLVGNLVTCYAKVSPGSNKFPFKIDVNSCGSSWYLDNYMQAVLYCVVNEKDLELAPQKVLNGI